MPYPIPPGRREVQHPGRGRSLIELGSSPTLAGMPCLVRAGSRRLLPRLRLAKLLLLVAGRLHHPPTQTTSRGNGPQQEKGEAHSLHNPHSEGERGQDQKVGRTQCPTYSLGCTAHKNLVMPSSRGEHKGVWRRARPAEWNFPG